MEVLSNELKQLREKFNSDIIIRSHLREIEGVFQYRACPYVVFDELQGTFQIGFDYKAIKRANHIIHMMQEYINMNYKELNLILKPIK